MRVKMDMIYDRVQLHRRSMLSLIDMNSTFFEELFKKIKESTEQGKMHACIEETTSLQAEALITYCKHAELTWTNGKPGVALGTGREYTVWWD